jgi:cytochrome c oxidase subunit IV
MLTVAIVKAMFVVLYFMHVRWGSRLTWVIAGSGFLWLLIMFSFTLMDYMSRGWLQGTLR